MNMATFDARAAVKALAGLVAVMAALGLFG